MSNMNINLLLSTLSVLALDNKKDAFKALFKAYSNEVDMSDIMFNVINGSVEVSANISNENEDEDPLENVFTDLEQETEDEDEGTTEDDKETSSVNAYISKELLTKTKGVFEDDEVSKWVIMNIPKDEMPHKIVDFLNSKFKFHNEDDAFRLVYLFDFTKTTILITENTTEATNNIIAPLRVLGVELMLQ